MKKIATLLVMIIALCLLSGCSSSKKLTCERSYEQAESQITEKVTIDFKNDAVVSLNHEIRNTLPDSQKDFLSFAKQAQESAMKLFKDEKGITTTVTSDNLTIITVMKVEPTKLSKEMKATLDMDENVAVYESAKKFYTESEFTCK